MGPFWAAVYMPHAAQKGPLHGHEKGFPSPDFSCHECDDMIALLGEKNCMQIGRESVE